MAKLNILLIVSVTAFGGALRSFQVQPGTVVKGKIVSETQSELRLDVDPCDTVRNVQKMIVITPPYTKDLIKTVTCNGQTWDEVQIEKK